MYSKEIDFKNHNGLGKFTVNLPNAGELITIESLKMTLTSGSYNELVTSGLKTSALVLDLVDSMAYFFTLIPQLAEKYKINSYKDIDAKTSIVFSSVFKKQFWPWYTEIMDMIEKEVEEAHKELQDAKEENSN